MLANSEGIKSANAGEVRSREISLGTMHFQGANEEIHATLDECDELILRDVFAQRYIGCAMPAGKRISIYGTPGNDLAAYMDGGHIEVFGNAQDQIGNTMNAGSVIVHGRCGDAAGYAMRGGTILVRDDCGWRVGINMKQYESKCPTIVIGGDAGNFLGEYMAGGTIMLLGTPGAHLATGMHGGVIYIRSTLKDREISDELEMRDLDEADAQRVGELLGLYAQSFAEDGRALPTVTVSDFLKIVPRSSRPYANMYAS